MAIQPIWKPYERIVYDNWIERIHTEAWDLLTDWEKRFINDIENQLTVGGTRNLSKPQSDKLEQIYAGKTK